MEPSCPRCESYDPKNPQGRGAMCRRCLLNGLSEYSPTKQALEMEVSALSAELAAIKAGRVVVPELKTQDPDFMTLMTQCDGPVAVHMIHAGYGLALSRARAVSPSDILQPGEVKVDREELEELEALYQATVALKDRSEHTSLRQKVAVNRLDALRSKDTP